jgi:hypothetical protein
MFIVAKVARRPVSACRQKHAACLTSDIHLETWGRGRGNSKLSYTLAVLEAYHISTKLPELHNNLHVHCAFTVPFIADCSLSS